MHSIVYSTSYVQSTFKSPLLRSSQVTCYIRRTRVTVFQIKQTNKQTNRGVETCQGTTLTMGQERSLYKKRCLSGNNQEWVKVVDYVLIICPHPKSQKIFQKRNTWRTMNHVLGRVKYAKVGILNFSKTV